MAVQVILAAATAAGTSSSVSCPADGRLTIGMRALNSGGTLEVPIGQYLGCPIWTSNGTANVGRPRDECGKPVVLTTPRPQVILEGAGTYVVEKGVTQEKVEIWADDGT